MKIVRFQQTVWRGHRWRYAALDHAGSLRKTGRFHRAPDLFPSSETWPALYTGIALHTAMGEVLRTLVRYDDIADYRFTEISVRLAQVADCRDPEALGVDMDQLFDDFDFGAAHALAAAARDLGVEGLLVSSATRLGDNLIVFPDRLSAGSMLVEIRSIDPNLVKAPR